MLQEPENSFAAQVLGRLAQKYGFANDTALGDHLGVTRQTISNWRTRDSLDYRLLLEKFPDADLNWLFRGHAAPSLGFKDAMRLLTDAGFAIVSPGAVQAPPAPGEGLARPGSPSPSQS